MPPILPPGASLPPSAAGANGPQLPSTATVNAALQQARTAQQGGPPPPSAGLPGLQQALARGQMGPPPQMPGARPVKPGGPMSGPPQMPQGGQFSPNMKPPGLPAGMPPPQRPMPSQGMQGQFGMRPPADGGAFGGQTKAPTLAGQFGPMAGGQFRPR